eukprot:140013_1
MPQAIEQCTSNSYILSNEQFKIVSLSDQCRTGTIEINDHMNGWNKITSTDHCSLPTDSSFNAIFGDTICKQLGFDGLNWFDMSPNQHNAQNMRQIGYNNIMCDVNTTDICKQCTLKYKGNEIMDDCDHWNVFIECKGNSNLKCINSNDYIEDDNINSKCNNISYTLASKPFYEDDTFILVVVIIGIVILACCTICTINYIQTEHNRCMKCRALIKCLTCKCFGYEGDEPEPIPFDVSPQKKAKLKAQQRGFDEQTAYW